MHAASSPLACLFEKLDALHGRLSIKLVEVFITLIHGRIMVAIALLFVSISPEVALVLVSHLLRINTSC